LSGPGSEETVGSSTPYHPSRTPESEAKSGSRKRCFCRDQGKRKVAMMTEQYDDQEWRRVWFSRDEVDAVIEVVDRFSTFGAVPESPTPVQRWRRQHVP
jgi:hypothetical protein